MPEFYKSWKWFKKKMKGNLMNKECRHEYKMAVVPGLRRNEGVGDYFENADGSWTILATKLPDKRHSNCILAHELIEVMLIREAGIPEPVIDAFDAYFEVKRTNGLVGPDDEPGDDPESPYYKQHQVATRIEKILCEEGYNLSWDEYCQAVNEAE